MAYRIRNIFAVVVDLIMAAVAFFLGMRIILELFAANPSTPFVAWIYSVSSTLMYPFAGLLPNLEIPGIGFLDITALVTLLAYSIIGYLVIGALRTALPAPVEDYGHRHLV